ncbi:LysM peptidoglycan-binding domain-containing protein [Vibrio parahaemolyticus]|uniref:LysM peptidoglycan-binding domain-containing protein n=1 Tax=Vibrio harveyi group TaxID=717610 RepID=UPI000C86AAD3|nr:LysM domain-containing protein [Vibrio parahaemolyticus]QLK44804.1 LysM domain-containing protein [Vibrio owensii]AYO02921.1 LysM domain-containing protein [Vibrio parahaemolyticus]EHK0753061.1 LysM peptidoglycan-binding domain-containing protein [Vibrio parahaemolyticus]EHR5320118.1 LysM peptidoglycan-binding domain-containing protein [Vibrio parahaemolyticus]EJB8454275.1 LysM peptidoglycan-binding domain-containing protein [Vibrio parahaemolyticus]
MNTLYKIKEGDCLGLIAKRFNTSKEKLAALNSSQIKHLDLIYAGNTLTIDLPKPIEMDGARIDLPKAPSEMNGGNDTCAGKRREWADILYVPSHPTAGEKRWYAISKEAAEIIKAEQQLLSNGIVLDDNKSTLQHLERLGVLSKFSAKGHEQFMAKEETAIYRTLLWTVKVIETHTYGQGEWNPNDLLLSAAALVDIDLEASRTALVADRNAKNKTLYYGPFTSLYHGQVEEKSEEVKAYFNKTINQQLRALVLRKMREKIASMEKSAEDTARSKVAEDGSKFVYDKKLKYFTTQKEEGISTWLTQYREARNQLKTEEEIALSTHEAARQYVENWSTQLEESMTGFNDAVSGSTQNQNTFLNEQKGHFQCGVALQYLNQQGIVVKEQCLTLDQLEGIKPQHQGPTALQSISWRQSENGKAKPLDITQRDVELAINASYEELKDTTLDVPLPKHTLFNAFNETQYEWSYYPTLALIAVVDATITHYQAELSQLLGGNGTPFDVIFGRLLWIKKVAQHRLAILKIQAHEVAKQGAMGLRFVLGEKHAMPAVLTSIWNESSFEPKQANKMGFINQAGFNDIQVVECSLLSDGKLGYIRGPHWYMPESEETNHASNFHVKVLTKEITFGGVTENGSNVVEATQIGEAVKQLSNPKLTVDLLPIKQSLEKTSAFWSDSYHQQEGMAPTQEAPSYSVDAGAQLLRLVTKAEGEINQPLSSYRDAMTKPKNFGASGNVSATFTALQGQLGFTCWLPLREENQNIVPLKPEKVQGYQFDCPWVDTSGHEQSFPMGHFSACVTGSVYALAAATCQLSSKFEFGPTHIDEGFGIKGNTVGLFEPNIHAAYLIHQGTFTSATQAKMATEAKVAVNAFAGVEAGGKLDASVYWKSPEMSTPFKLGSIDGEFSAAYGAGYDAQFELKLQGGVLLLIAKAGLVLGPGCSGKVAIALDAEATDALLQRLFSLLKRSEFRRLACFGEVDEHGRNESFELLNDVVTIAVATGLTVSSALLIPVELWGNYKQQALSDKYAPAIARRMNLPAYQKTTQPWVEKLPPETISRLLNCLLKRQSSAEANYKQAQAIVQIMQWLAEDRKESMAANQRQWKEALIAMGDLPKGEKDHPLEWQTYKEQWFRLASFVKDFDERYTNTLKNAFNLASKTLCGNMLLTRTGEHRRQAYGFSFGVETSEYEASQYTAYPVSTTFGDNKVGEKARLLVNVEQSLISGGYKQTEEEIVEWSIADVF